MKLLSILIVFLLAQTMVCGQIYVFEKQYKNYRQADNLSGKVKSVKEIHYKTVPVNDSFRMETDWYFLYSYNTAGNLEMKRQVRQDESVARLENYFYNDRQQLVKMVGTSPGSSASAEETTIYKYDDKSHLTEHELTLYNGSLVINHTTLKHDAKGRVVELRMDRPLDNSWELRLYTYDKQDRVIEMKTVSKKTTNQTVYQYLGNNKILTTNRWNLSKDGKPAKSTVQVLGFDTHHNLSWEVYDKGATAQPEWERVYEYDSYGNWIKAFIKNNQTGQLNRIPSETRTISYY